MNTIAASSVSVMWGGMEMPPKQPQDSAPMMSRWRATPTNPLNIAAMNAHITPQRCSARRASPTTASKIAWYSPGMGSIWSIGFW